MFRVLSDEESQKVTRWHAPEIESTSAVVANTRQEAKPRHSPDDKDVLPLLGSSALKNARSQAPGVPPKLQTINAIDVFSNPSIAEMHRMAVAEQSPASGVAQAASAEMLQSSYDEGYDRGFAEGNAALQQHSIKELKQVISAIADASAYEDEAGLEQAVLSLSRDIVRLVIRHEVTMDASLMLDIVKAGIAQLPGANRGVQCVNLHPLDANVVRRHIADNECIQIIDDPMLERGACRIESGASVIHAGTDNWLDTVSMQLGLQSEHDSHAMEDSAYQDKSNVSEPPLTL